MRFLLHIPRRTIQLALLGVVLVIVVFFALTRTQVGRDALRDEIVRQADRALAGRLEIGRLRGNLVNELYATDLRLYDPDGGLVVQVDSAVILHDWRDLLRRRLTLRRAHLIRPSVHLARADSSWNLLRALAPASARDQANPAVWGLNSVAVTVEDGTLDVRNDGPVPSFVENGIVFDLTNGRATFIDLAASIEATDEYTLIDVSRSRFRLPLQNVNVTDARTQVVLREGTLALNGLRFNTEASRVAGHLTVSRAEGNGAPRLEATLEESLLDPDEFLQLMPAYPFALPLTLRATLSGPLDGLAVTDFEARVRQTRLSGDGRLAFVPDSLRFRLALRPSSVRLSDVAAAVPRLPLEPVRRADPATLSGDFEGAVALRPGAPLRMSGTFAAVDGSQEAGGRFTFKTFLDGPPRFTYSGDATRIDPGWLDRARFPAGQFSGRVDVTVQDSRYEVRTVLDDATLLGRTLSGLDATLTVDDAGLRTTGTARTGEGTVVFQVERSSDGRFDLRFDARDADLGPLLDLPSLTTAATGTLTITGSGDALPTLALRAKWNADALRTTWEGNTRRAGPHGMQLAISPLDSTGSERFVLSGDFGRLAASSNAPTSTVADAAAHWTAQLVRTAQDAWVPGTADSTATSSAWTLPYPIDVSTHADLRRADLLAPYLPFLPLLSGTATVSAAVAVDSTGFRLYTDGTLADVGIGTSRLRGGTWTVEAHVLGAADGPPMGRQSLQEASTLRATLSLEAGDIESFPLEDVRGGLSMAEGRIEVRSSAGTLGSFGSTDIAAAVDVMANAHDVQVSAASVGTDDYRWQLVRPARIGVYTDRIAFTDFDVANGEQQVTLDGTLSASTADVLDAQVNALSLRGLLARFGVETVSGEVNADVAIRAGFGRAELTGDVSAERLAFRDRPLGRVTATSRYLPSAQALGLELRLTPEGETPRPNALTLGGTFRLPIGDDGTLDLTADLERADLFFLEELFPTVLSQVTGALTGRGTIRGTFRKPDFDANLRLQDAAITIPTFDLYYTGSGPVQVRERTLVFPGLRLEDGHGGTADVAGRIDLDRLDQVRLDLAGTLDRLEVINAPPSPDLAFYGRIAASGPVALSGSVSNAFLRAPDLTVTPQSQLFLPLSDGGTLVDDTFLVFDDDKTETDDDAAEPEAAEQRSFIDGLGMNLNFRADGATIHLVFDPLLDDVIEATGGGRIQLQRTDGDFGLFGTFQVEGGEYRFNANELLTRRFDIQPGGTIRWNGDVTNAALSIPAAYRTRASLAGLPEDLQGQIGARTLPLRVNMQLSGDVQTPIVTLRLDIPEDERGGSGAYEFLEQRLNRPDLRAEYATSVLLTNSFVLTTALAENTAEISTAAGGLAFNSLSQLVASSLNRFIGSVLENVDVTLGVQQAANETNYDLSYGVALRLLDERLVIRGEGIYQTDPALAENVQGELMLEYRLNDNVSVEVFYRREGDVLVDQSLGVTSGAYGAGLSFQTEFANWQRFLRRLRGESATARTDPSTSPGQPGRR